MTARSLLCRTLVIRPASTPDIAAIRRLDRLCLLTSWSALDYRSLIRRPEFDFQIAAASQEVVGFYLSLIGSGQMELLKIGVAPGRRGQGVGRSLLDQALQQGVQRGATDCFLEVRSGNRQAITFYFRNHFEFLDVRRDYYVNPREDAWIMRRDLKASRP